MNKIQSQKDRQRTLCSAKSAQSQLLVLLYYIKRFSHLNKQPTNQQPKKQTDYSRTPLILTNWDGEPSGYAENPDYWIFL
jgi:hypothetical protein